MIHQQLHRQPVALDRDAHRTLKIRAQAPDWSVAAALNGYVVHAVEFADLSKEFPLVFIRVGHDDASGKPLVAPLAVFGLAQGENLFVDGSRWSADYMPAQLRAYPFATARVDARRHAICIDRAWAGFSESEGTPLFGDDGQPGALVREMRELLDRLEGETQRTRAFCDRLLALDLLRDMRFDATLPDGQKIAVDGFLAVDEKRLAELADADIVALHRDGLLALVTLHQFSLGNLRRLVERRRRRQQAPS